MLCCCALDCLSSKAMIARARRFYVLSACTVASGPCSNYSGERHAGRSSRSSREQHCSTVGRQRGRSELSGGAGDGPFLLRADDQDAHR
jgi:hypothetical protein